MAGAFRHLKGEENEGSVRGHNMEMPDATDRVDAFQGRAFRTTHWSIVVCAGQGETGEAAVALEKLCRAYWYPLYAHVRFRGYDLEEAKDLTQAFFLQLIAKGYLAEANPEKGRFRTFLLSSLGHFLTNEWNKSQTQKRGGKLDFISLDYIREKEDQPLDIGHDATPERIYEKRWAEAVLAQVMERLRAEYDGAQVKRFDVLKTFLTTDRGTVSYAEAAAQLGMKEQAVKSAIHRMRQRWRELMREEISHTLNTASNREVDEEIYYLLGVLD